MGRPVIWYSIQTALNSALTRVVVSTDGKEIAKVASAYKVDAINRPAEYATDTARIELAVRHTLEYCESQEDTAYDAVMLLQNSSPLRIPNDINRCIAYLELLDYDSVVSVMAIHEHPYKVKTIVKDKVVSWMPEMDVEFYRRQDLPEMYIDNGAIYLIRRDVFLEYNKVMAGKCGAYIMPRERSLDIHNKWDAVMAEALIEKGILNETGIQS